jgi:hypothetical protein
LVVSAEVIPAVNTAIAMTDTTIQTIATIRPGSVAGAVPPLARWVMVLVDHQTPELMPRAIPPPKPSLTRRSKSQIRAPAKKARPSKTIAACKKLKDPIERITGPQLVIRLVCTATPVPVWK